MTSRPCTNSPLRTRASLQQSTSMVSFPSANFRIKRRAAKRKAWSPYRPHGCFSRPETSQRKSIERSPKGSWETLRVSRATLEGTTVRRMSPSPIRAYRGKRHKYTYYTPSISLQTTEASFPTVLSLKGKSERIKASQSRSSHDNCSTAYGKFARNSDCASNTDIL